MEKVWVIEDPDEYLNPQRTKRLTKELPDTLEKSPAVAYSFSIFFWGGGQIYNDQKRKGFLFLFFMLFLFIGVILSLVYRKNLIPFLMDHHISHVHAFVISELLLFCGLIFWHYNAGDAYHRAVKTRRQPFIGIQSHIYPFICSLVMPGWGQFLNGQPVKGSIFSGFSIISLFSLISAPCIILAWPALEASEARFIIEGIFTCIVLFSPLIPVLWIFSGFDALKVSIDDLKKEPLFDRIKYANNRRRTQGLVRGVIPHIKSTLLFVLVLLFLLIFTYYYSPIKYYGEQLMSFQAWLQKLGMTIMPELIGRLRSLAAFMGK